MRTALLLIFLISTIFISQAQTVRRPSMSEPPSVKAERVMNHPRFSKLNLSDDQKPKVKTIWTQHYSSVDRIVQNAERSGSDKSVVEDQISRITETTNKKIMVLLNDEQKKVYESILESSTGGYSTSEIIRVPAGQAPPN